jgi:hypothetical protein
VEPVRRGVFLYLSDGRLFIRRDSGEIRKADASERGQAISMLALEECGTVDPTRGLELLPPAES